LDDRPKSHTTVVKDADLIISMGITKAIIQNNGVDGSGFQPTFTTVPCIIRPDFQKITIGQFEFPPIETGRVNGNTLGGS
jgi:hypothetical protein